MILDGSLLKLSLKMQDGAEVDERWELLIPRLAGASFDVVELSSEHGLGFGILFVITEHRSEIV